MNRLDKDELEDEGPLSIDLEELGGEDDSQTLPCPVCGEEIYEDSNRCDRCGQYILMDKAAQTHNQWRNLLLALLAAAAVIILLHLAR